MCDQKVSMSSPQKLHELMDVDVENLREVENLMPEGKSLSELIIKLLKSKGKLKLKNQQNNEDVQPTNKPNQMFPWMNAFTASCRQVIPEPSIKKLDQLVTTFLKNIEEDVKQCYNKPKRAYKLRLRMNNYLVLFHMLYWEIKKPLEHTSYLDKMSDIMAMYIDLEIKSSRSIIEHPNKTAQRICTSLFLFLDKSYDHMLDSILKSKFFVKKYSDVCVPILARLLKDNPGQMFETTYVRYLLSFKLWKTLAGKDQSVNITKDAVAKLKPPANFAEQMKGGLFSNVLPYVSKSEKDRLTFFFMKSPFNVKKKAQIFLKDWRKILPGSDTLEKVFSCEEDFTISLFDGESQETEDSLDLMDEIWSGLVDKESEDLEDLLEVECIEEEKIFIDLTLPKNKDKSKKSSKLKSNDGVVKVSQKKRKPVKMNSTVPIQNLLNTECKEVIRVDKSKPLLIPVSSKEGTAVSTSSNMEETQKKDEKCLHTLSNVSESLKLQKPCATVEPEKCKEIEREMCKEIELEKCIKNEPDKCEDFTPNKCPNSTDVLTQSNPQKTPIDSVEDVHEEIDLHEDKSGNNVKGSKTLVVPNVPVINSIEVQADLSHSDKKNPSCEIKGNKVDSSTESILCVDNIFENIKIDERLLDDQLVAEEIVIDSVEGPGFLILEENINGNPEHRDLINSIEIPIPLGSDQVIFNSGKCIEKGKFQKEIVVPLLEPQVIPVNSVVHCKPNCIKEQSSISPENHFLSLTVSSESNGNNYHGPMYQTRDGYTYNDILLTKLFSDVNGDEISDDDTRYHNRRQYAGGGKISAFREQMDESKSDIGDEFESSSPASQTDSQKSLSEKSPKTCNSQPPTLNTQSKDCNPEEKSNPLIPVKGDLSYKTNTIAEEKSVLPDSPQLQEASVKLPCVTDLGNIDDCHVDKKISKGMCEPPDSILHFKTVDDDVRFYYLQHQLCTLYNTTQNILDTDPVPYPPTVIVSPPIGGYVRCPCVYCNTNFVNLDRNYKILFAMRSNRVCLEIDKKRLFAKMYLELDQTKMENDRLLKSIEETIPSSEQSKDNEPISDALKKKELINEISKEKKPIIEISNEKEPIQLHNEVADLPTREDVKEEKEYILEANQTTLEINHDSKEYQSDIEKTVETCENENQNETKSEYSNLPPKKRKAFNLQSGMLVGDLNQQKDNYENLEKENVVEQKKVKYDCKDIINFNNKTEGNRLSTDNSCLVENVEFSEPVPVTKQCRVVVDKYSPVKIKSVDGFYCVLSEKSDHGESQKADQDNSIGDSWQRHEKCHKHHKRSKEEKRLRKERKRLKKLMKQEKCKS